MPQEDEMGRVKALALVVGQFVLVALAFVEMVLFWTLL